MQFFQQFPNIEYTLTENGGSQTMRLPRVVPNMTVKLKMNIFDDVNLPYSEYRINDEDRPDTVAAVLYGSARYAWVILLANNMRDWYDWPLTDIEFSDYMNRKYESSYGARDGVEVSSSTVSRYIWNTTTGQSLDVDVTAFSALPPEQQETETVYDHEYAENDARRMIRVPLLDAMESIINQLNLALGQS